MLILHGAYNHWSVAVVTVTVHDSFFPTFDFLKYVAFCNGFNLLTSIFLLPYIIMDLPIFLITIRNAYLAENEPIDPNYYLDLANTKLKHSR